MNDEERKQLQETVLGNYLELKKKLGRQPKNVDFKKEYNFRQCQKAFGKNAYSKLIKFAGDEQLSDNNNFVKKYTLSDALTTYGNFAKKIGHYPTMPEWSHEEVKPSSSWFQVRQKMKWTEVRQAFIKFAQDKPEWATLLESLPKEAEEVVVEPSFSEEDDTSYLPQCVKNLEALSTQDGSSLEFERAVNIAFRILGFQVLPLGQGTGRNPDGIALDVNSHFAIIIDAKNSREGYSLGVDDRKFIEYFKTWQSKLRSKGMEHLFLCVISSRFKSNNEKPIANIKNGTYAKEVSLVTSKQLLKLVIAKIKYSSQFELKDLKEMLVTDGGLSSKRLVEWIEGMDKKYNANIVI